MSDGPSSPNASPELSVVIPCLNEAETLGTCVGKALRAMEEAEIDGEVIVADNGSTDGSVEIARSLGARVVPVAEKGYGSALMGGIAAANGEFVIMGDADDSYDFLEIPRFVAALRGGAQLAQGCRLPSGGGTIAKGAMPTTHRWIGNPLFSFLARWWFKSPVHDVYCGLRGFRKDFYESLDQRCTGMEFATEMILRSALAKARTAEVPITLHRDGRQLAKPHLRTLQDGWRTLRLFLLYTPRWLFLVPGIVLLLLGAVGYALALPQTSFGEVTLGAHTLLFASLAVLCGYQSIVFAVLARVFASSEGFLPPDPLLEKAFGVLTLERGLVGALLVALGGTVLLALAVLAWRNVGFGELDYASTMRLVIPGATLVALGFQSVLFGFFVSMMGLRRR